MKNKVLGGMIGLCVGDALGVPVEFRRREDLARDPVTGMRGYGTYNQPPGTWSDDTSMALCLLDSLSDTLDHADIMNKFRSWYEGGEYTPYGVVFDAGRTTGYAIARFTNGIEPLRCGASSENSNGNGSLMRTLPLAFYLRSRFGEDFMGEDKTFGIIHDVSSLTHAHKRSLIACGIYVSVAERLIVGTDDLKEGIRSGIGEAKKHYEKDPEFESELRYYGRLFSEGFADLPESCIRSSGYVVDTLEAAVWCLLNTDTYKDCVLKAVNLGGDTDTVAAVAGGLAGTYYGVNGIPKEWKEQIPRLDHIKRLCGKMIERIASIDDIAERMAGEWM